jgi:hypothetical protein
VETLFWDPLKEWSQRRGGLSSGVSFCGRNLFLENVRAGSIDNVEVVLKEGVNYYSMGTDLGTNFECSHIIHIPYSKLYIQCMYYIFHTNTCTLAKCQMFGNSENYSFKICTSDGDVTYIVGCTRYQLQCTCIYEVFHAYAKPADDRKFHFNCCYKILSMLEAKI